jgi:hypothetical protein
MYGCIYITQIELCSFQFIFKFIFNVFFSLFSFSNLFPLMLQLCNELILLSLSLSLSVYVSICIYVEANTAQAKEGNCVMLAKAVLGGAKKETPSLVNLQHMSKGH